MATRNPITKTCTIRCLARTAHCAPRFAKSMKCEKVPGGYRCLGSCRMMQSACFGRGRPIFDAAWILVFVHPPQSENADINNVTQNPSPPFTNNPPNTLGFLVANSVSSTEYVFNVQSTRQETPRLGLSAAFEQPRFITTSPLRYGASVHWIVNGEDMGLFTGRPTVPNGCNRDKSSVYGNPQTGDACLFQRPWVIRAPNEVFFEGDIVREHDRFLLEDAYGYGRERRYLTWVPPVGPTPNCALVDPNDPESGYQPGCGTAAPGYFRLADRKDACLFSANLVFGFQRSEKCNFNEDALINDAEARPLADPAPSSPDAAGAAGAAGATGAAEPAPPKAPTTTTGRLTPKEQRQRIAASVILVILAIAWTYHVRKRIASQPSVFATETGGNVFV